jgi:glycosyltransferase involved in cell wall biosynthesis
MAVMDIFVLTSLREGLPRVLVQASAIGMPSIAFNVAGVPEIIKDDYNGFLVEPGNIEQLTNQIKKYINNRELISLHGKKGKEFIGNKWSIEGMVDRIDKIYLDLVREKLGEMI